ncbi:MAG TPA: DUF1489 domain-containing protein [Acetobacteraceae bacterium]
MKLAVGAGSLAQLRAWQAQRLKTDPPLRHLTRSFPRRAAEVLDGGSLYWVVAGAMTVRQRITDIVASQREDGSQCAALILDPALVPVAARAVKPFQGWRYLPATSAPPDIGPESEAAGEMPEAMREKLRMLGLV